MTSHEYAHKMQELAQWMLEHVEFDVAHAVPTADIFYHDKDTFLTAARALGSGDKQYVGEDSLALLVFKPHTPLGTKLEINIRRDKVCRIVTPAQAAVYDCEPLLSQEEADSVGVGAGPTCVEEAANG